MAAGIRSEVPKTADVVVIGGGVYGCSIAYNLVNQGAGNVVILERGNLGSGGTAKSCAIVRTHYSIHVNMVHAVESLKIFQNFGEIVGGDAGFRRTGYLIVGPEEHREPMEAVFRAQNGLGIDTATLTTEEAAKGMTFATHGTTYGGNPLAMAVGLTVIEEVLADGFLDHVNAMGTRLRAALEQLIPNHDDMFEAVRGLGLMLGVKMKDAYDARSFVAHLRDHHGLLAVSAGQNVLRILPPLVIEENHIAEAIEKISAGARSCAEAKAA